MAKKVYQCSGCSKIHEYHHEAERCCQPEVLDCWLCPVCDEGHDEEGDAETCCAGKVEPDASSSCPNCLRQHNEVLHVFEIEVAGHCSYCNPSYSVDQLYQIQDRLDEHAEEHAYRCRH